VKVLHETKYTSIQKKTTSCTWYNHFTIFSYFIIFLISNSRDHLFIFQFKLFADEMNTGRINLSVYNANTLTRNDLIGAHDVDLMRVYQSPGTYLFPLFFFFFVPILLFFFVPIFLIFFFFTATDHELYNTWIALVDTTNKFSGVQGYP
jgi:hypothetical protein